MNKKKSNILLPSKDRIPPSQDNRLKRENHCSLHQNITSSSKADNNLIFNNVTIAISLQEDKIKAVYKNFCTYVLSLTEKDFSSLLKDPEMLLNRIQNIQDILHVLKIEANQLNFIQKGQGKNVPNQKQLNTPLIRETSRLPYY